MSDKIDSKISKINDHTFQSVIPFGQLFEIAKEEGRAEGGKVKSENMDTGTLSLKYKYGINPTGIRVDVQFRRADDGSNEVSVRGRIGDSFDTTGAGSAKGRAVFNRIAQRIEDGDLPASSSTEKVTAPTLGDPKVQDRGKIKLTTTLLAFFLGGLGAHRFYLGSWGWGLVFVGLTFLGGWGFIPAFFDGLRYAFMKPANFNAKYNYSNVGAFTF
jgi:TM2 domain-containing membrane protein YozV